MILNENLVNNSFLRIDLFVADRAYFEIIAAGFTERMATLYQYHGSVGGGVELYAADYAFLSRVNHNELIYILNLTNLEFKLLPINTKKFVYSDIKNPSRNSRRIYISKKLIFI